MKSVVFHKDTFAALRGGIAEGLLDVGVKALDRARPNVPDAPPEGIGLVNTGAAVVFVDGQRAGGTANIDTPEEKGIVLAAGYDFPGRFNELGTINQPPRPFWTPAFLAEAREVVATVKPHVTGKLGGLR